MKQTQRLYNETYQTMTDGDRFATYYNSTAIVVECDDTATVESEPVDFSALYDALTDILF